jgi:2-C-methyl-D-erythritol 4-phosphate cytidylyltransferase/2-C-methyl-D-erythritol 2,4-cyclodiphosphate synthase
MYVTAIIAAGGTGARIGGSVPKQLIDLGDESNMLSRSLQAFLDCGQVDEIVLVAPPGVALGAGDRPAKPFKVVGGGERRQDSVAKAFARVSDTTDVVVIHDAARPFVTPDLIGQTIRAAADHGAAIAALAATDTVKQASDQHADGTIRIRATLPRDTIYLAQTPQAFRRTVLAEAMAVAGDETFTDEAMLVERAGFPVHIVPGDPGNIKVTTPHDLTVARQRVSKGETRPTRIGCGYDLHRLVEGRPLVLAGVGIPFERGLYGHSDADIVCHAVTDAVLGAAALGDIGRLFPDTDAAWQDADSVRMLEMSIAAVHAKGLRVVNVDVTVIAERPKLLPYLDEMRANLARALQIEAEAVSIKGKTNEAVDATGRGEAMAAHAVALLTLT